MLILTGQTMLSSAKMLAEPILVQAIIHFSAPLQAMSILPEQTMLSLETVPEPLTLPATTRSSVLMQVFTIPPEPGAPSLGEMPVAIMKEIIIQVLEIAQDLIIVAA